MSKSGRRFDAPHEPARGSVALRFVLSHWGVALALAWVLAVSLAAALGLVVFDRTNADSAAAAVRSVTIAAVVDPQASVADAKALGARLASIPDVGETVFRSKDEGLKALTVAGLPAPDGRNPLPDLWLMRIKPESVLATPRSLSDVLGNVRRAAAAQLQVSAVRVDDTLVAALEPSLRYRRAFGPGLMWGGLGLIALLWAAAAYLAGSASSGRDSPGGLALALFTIVSALGAVSVLVIAAIILASVANDLVDPTLQASVREALVDRRFACGALPVVAWIVVLLGYAAGSDHAPGR
jgi:hypothetical protein